MRQQKRLLTLPQEVRDKFLVVTDVDERNEYIVRLRKAGWTLDSIAQVTGMTRERVRQIQQMSSSLAIELDDSFIVPNPPFYPEKPKRQFVEPSPETLARLLELQPLAKQVRSNAKRFRAEAEEYTALLNHAHAVEGVTLYRLGLRLGVTHSAIRFRLSRYGYKPSPNNADSKVYKPILAENRFINS